MLLVGLIHFIFTPGTAFSETLQYITAIKLQELERQRDACKAYVDDTLKRASAEEDPIERVSILLDSIRDWKGVGGLVSPTVVISNYDSYVVKRPVTFFCSNHVTSSWLYQARHDGSISSEQVNSWATTLETELHQAVTRFDYAKLFGDLLNEWISSGDSLALPPAHDTAADGDEGESQSGAPVEKKPRSMRQGKQLLLLSPLVT